MEDLRKKGVEFATVFEKFVKEQFKYSFSCLKFHDTFNSDPFLLSKTFQLKKQLINQVT